MPCGASWPPRVRLAGQLGETLAALHQLAPPVIRDWCSRWVESPSRPPVLLHTEVMRQHPLTAEGPEGHRGCPG